MAEVESTFEREHGCTEADWLRDLPGAVGSHVLTLPGPGEADVTLEDGSTLSLRWQVLPERRIALIRLPRMLVRYAFSAGVSVHARAQFMRLFDLHMRRGGG